MAYGGDVSFTSEAYKGAIEVMKDSMDELTDNVEDIVFTTSKGKYKITYKKAKEKGFYRVFQGETKLIVPQKEWEFFNESNR